MQRRNCSSLIYGFLIVVLAIQSMDSTLSKTDKSSKKSSKQKAKMKAHSGTSDSTTIVGDGSTGGGSIHLVDDGKLTADEILQNHQIIDFDDIKKFPNEVLGYVTPWNNHGYDIGKWLSNKFTHISPVWFQIVPSQADAQSQVASCAIAGNHDNDQGWVRDVRRNHSDIYITPRFIFEKWNGQQLRNLFSYEDQQIKCAKVVTDFLKRNKFKGAIVEIWVSVMSMSQGMASGELTHFLTNVGETFHENDLQILIPVPPPIEPSGQPSILFNADHYKALLPFIDYFQVMTYDYPERRAGPVAPIDWVQRCMETLIKKSPDEKHKLLMGLNFYGYDYAAMGSKVEPVVGHRYLEMLRTDKPELVWNKVAAEHYIEYRNHIVYYPSLISVEARLSLAKELGVGIGIWEIGQGLNYFYNLL